MHRLSLVLYRLRIDKPERLIFIQYGEDKKNVHWFEKISETEKWQDYEE